MRPRNKEGRGEESVTREMSASQTRGLVEASKEPSEKETIPEIPARKLIAAYEAKQAKKASKQTVADTTVPEDAKKTKPGVPIQVGKDKVLYVEEDKVRDKSEDTGEIIG